MHASRTHARIPHKYAHSYISACTCACVHAYMCACIHVCTHLCIHTWVHAYMRASTHAYMGACIHVCIHTCVNPYMRACIHAMGAAQLESDSVERVESHIGVFVASSSWMSCGCSLHVSPSMPPGTGGPKSSFHALRSASSESAQSSGSSMSLLILSRLSRSDVVGFTRAPLWTRAPIQVLAIAASVPTTSTRGGSRRRPDFEGFRAAGPVGRIVRRF